MHAERTRAGADARSAAGVRSTAIGLRAVVIAGPPASGKTTLGAALARALHYAFIDLDIVTAAMTRVALALLGADETALDGALGDRLRDARYGALLDTAAANLAVGQGVVLSAPFTRERGDAARWEAVRGQLGCSRGQLGGSRGQLDYSDVALICLDLDEELRRQRMRARGAPRDRVKLSASGGAAEQSAPPAGAICLEASARPDALFHAALAALDARTAGAGRLFDRDGQEPSQHCPDPGSQRRADPGSQHCPGPGSQHCPDPGSQHCPDPC